MIIIIIIIKDECKCDIQEDSQSSLSVVYVTHYT